MAGCGASSLPPTASSATPTETSVFGVWPSDSRRASPTPPVQVTPTPTPQPADVPVEWLYISDPTYGISWKEPNSWYGIQENWPISIPGAILLGAVASEKNAPLLLSSPQPIFPNGLMVFTVYALRAEVPPPALHDAQPITVSGQTGWIQETNQYWYHLWFGCAPGEGENEAREAFVAQCTDVMEHILGSFQIGTACTSAGAAVAPSPATTLTLEKFPESLYPPPLEPNPDVVVAGGGGCPNLQGVTVPKPSREDLFAVFSRWGRTKEGDLELSDRAFWPVVEAAWEGKAQGGSGPVSSIEQIVSMPASESPYADLVRNYCGEQTLELSWCVAVLPEGARKIEDAPGLTEYYYLIQRLGRWLIWLNPH